VIGQLISKRHLAGWLLLLAFAIVAFGSCVPSVAQAQSAGSDSAADTQALAAVQRPLMEIGLGDTVTVEVFGQKDLDATVYVGDDGTVPLALVGSVQISGLSPADAAKRIEKALRDGHFVNDPHVTVTVVQSRSQRVSVLGEVTSPGRYGIDAKTSIFDLLAQAGGTRETGADLIYLMRADAGGHVTRTPVSLKGLTDNTVSMPDMALHGGDVVFVPKADQFYVEGEVQSPAMYRLEPNMTVDQAIARAGGITARGSLHRVQIKRRDGQGQQVVTGAKLGDRVMANDVIRVKESLF
jgi:polysaccharide export outer membrane protein